MVGLCGTLAHRRRLPAAPPRRRGLFWQQCYGSKQAHSMLCLPNDSAILAWTTQVLETLKDPLQKPVRCFPPAQR